MPGPAPVITDPLRLDSDSDLVADDQELARGGNPQDASDGADFVDSDLDGLTDAEETELGWNIFVNGGAALLVHSNPSRADSDFDGLPDFVERDIRSHPNNADTDGDGLTDYDDFADFADFADCTFLEALFPGVTIDGSNSKLYDTNPNHEHSDTDSITDWEELVEGYSILVPGESQPREIFTNPNNSDTDNDGLLDRSERTPSTGPFPPSYGTDGTDPDTDGDGRNDFDEVTSGSDPLVPDLSVTIRVLGFTGTNNATTDNTDTNPFLLEMG